MSLDERFCTVRVDDIDWESLASLDDDCKQRAKNLDIHFPTIVTSFHNGVAEVRWKCLLKSCFNLLKQWLPCQIIINFGNTQVWIGKHTEEKQIF